MDEPDPAGGASVVEAADTEWPVPVAEAAVLPEPGAEVTVPKEEELSLPVVGLTSLLETGEEEPVGTGTGTIAVELLCGAEAGELSVVGATVSVEVEAMVLSTVVVVSGEETGEAGDVSAGEVGEVYGYGTGVVAPVDSDGKLSDPEVGLDGAYDEGDDGRGAVSVTVKVLWPGKVASAESRTERAFVLSGLSASDSTVSASGLPGLDM